MDAHTYAAFFDELEKIGAQAPPPPSSKEKAIGIAAKARPWIKSSVTGAIPAAVAANFLLPGFVKDENLRKKLIAGAAALGAGAGVGDLALKRWASGHKRHEAAKEILKQGAMAASPGDLRRTGIGGVKRPPFPTEGSKQLAYQKIDNAQMPGKFTAATQPKHLRAPGPSIKHVSATPLG